MSKKQREKSDLNCRDRYEATAGIPCKKLTDADRKKAAVYWVAIVFIVIIALVFVL